MSAYMESVKNRLLARMSESKSGCWEWTGAKDRDGYGISSLHAKAIRVHRLAYLAFVGEIPLGLQIDHLCRNRKCFNPSHLECVTSRENTLRGIGITARAASVTHCLKGHPYDETNTYITPNGYRDCRTCRRDAVLRSRSARSAA